MHKIWGYSIIPIKTCGKPLKQRLPSAIKKEGKNKVITKTQMLTKLADATGFKKKEVQTVLDAQNDLLYKLLKKDKKFKLQGLGIFAVKRRKARTARNPQTGDLVKVPAKTVVRFRVGKDLKDSVLK